MQKRILQAQVSTSRCAVESHFMVHPVFLRCLKWICFCLGGATAGFVWWYVHPPRHPLSYSKLACCCVQWMCTHYYGNIYFFSGNILIMWRGLSARAGGNARNRLYTWIGPMVGKYVICHACLRSKLFGQNGQQITLLVFYFKYWRLFAPFPIPNKDLFP